VADRRAAEWQATRLRLSVLDQIMGAGFGHLGSCMSGADVVAGAFHVFDFSRDGHVGADYFILSKGHAAPLLYAATTPVGADIPYARAGSCFPAHPNAGKTPGVCVSSGSVGLGPAIALGIAVGLRLQGAPGRVVVLCGDGELQAGAVWEAVQNLARRPELPILLIVDANGYQGGMQVGTNNLTSSWLRTAAPRSRTLNGNDMGAILELMQDFAAAPVMTVAWAETKRGAGVSLLEHNPLPMTWRPTRQDAETIRLELQARLRPAS
jgi:transketolase